MANRVLRIKDGIDGSAEDLRAGIAKIREELGVSEEFPGAVDAEARAAAESVSLPERDATDLPFITLDPPSAMDLDQAMHLERDGDGFVVHYAIADVASFVEPGGAVDTEANRRGETLYGADSKVPLHPKPLSEDAASLLPDQIRPALLWTIRLDAQGNQTDASLERARVKSTAKLDYATVQSQIDDSSADPMLQLLREIGELRIALEKERGGVNLPMPEQEINVADDGTWSLEFRSVLPVEEWNAQISLLTGFAAASIMLKGKVGILRTMPPPEEHSVKRLRRTAKGLGIDWSADVDYPEFIRGLDSSVPAEAAMIVASTTLLRGAGYTAFDGEVPEQTVQSALAADYAHVTAPLRRLVDRYALEACVALCAGEEVPAWVRQALPELPQTMQESGRKANTYENAVVDLVEAFSLQGRVGETFTGVVTEVDREEKTKGTLIVREPAVEASVRGDDLPVGDEVTATLVTADPANRQISFELRA